MITIARTNISFNDFASVISHDRIRQHCVASPWPLVPPFVSESPKFPSENCVILRLGAFRMMVLTAFEASFVPFVSTGNSFLGGVHRLAALGALWVLSWLERHLGVVFLDVSLELEHSLTHLFSLLIQILLCWRRGWKGQKNVKKLGWESLRTST